MPVIVCAMGYDVAAMRLQAKRTSLGHRTRTQFLKALQRRFAEAESIAYLVVTAAGLDTCDYSVPYLAGWSGGDASVLRDTATRVVRTASRIDEDLAQLSRHDNPRLDGIAASLAVDAHVPVPAVSAHARWHNPER